MKNATVVLNLTVAFVFTLLDSNYTKHFIEQV